MAKEHDIWTYTPSPAAALVFLILFALLTLWHLIVGIPRRVWYFIPLIIGGLCESLPSCLRRAIFAMRSLA